MTEGSSVILNKHMELVKSHLISLNLNILLPPKMDITTDFSTSLSSNIIVSKDTSVLMARLILN